MFNSKAHAVLKIKELTFVNDCFQYKCNADSGHYGQTLISGRRLIDGHVFLQADIAVSPGNSGGPLLNTKGEIIGIVQSKIVNEGVEGIGFALPIDQAIEKLNLRIVE